MFPQHDHVVHSANSGSNICVTFAVFSAVSRCLYDFNVDANHILTVYNNQILTAFNFYFNTVEQLTADSLEKFQNHSTKMQNYRMFSLQILRHFHFYNSDKNAEIL